MVDAQFRRGAESAFARNRASADGLRATGDAALAGGPFSVIDKTVIPPSGDRHDYMSLGTYWWPDPAKADGLPYIRRDGQVNPDIERFDRPRLSQLADTVTTLAAAWHLGRDPAHAEHAAMLLRTWFLDPATRMNPHLRYGQAIPGHCDGRCIGIIDSECLVRIAQSVELLVGAPAWAQADDTALRAWFATYLAWLVDSELGREEAAQRNNHGTCYDVQVVGLALHLGQTKLARGIIADVPARRLAVQIGPDGRQPLELARTRAWTYSLKNLAALLNLAVWGRDLGVALWQWSGPDGRSLARAVDWLAPVALTGQPWNHAEISGCDSSALLPHLVRAAHLDPSRLPALTAAGIDVEAVCLHAFAGCPLGAVGAVGGRRGFH